MLIAVAHSFYKIPLVYVYFLENKNHHLKDMQNLKNTQYLEHLWCLLPLKDVEHLKNVKHLNDVL